MNGRGWSERELARLVALRARGAKWADISAALRGRSTSACTLAFYNIGAKRRREEARAKARAEAPRAPLKVRCIMPAVKPDQAPSRALPAPSAGVVATSRLVADAELRDRIAERGLTAGIFGDPAPGRSALDLKRASEARR